MNFTICHLIIASLVAQLVKNPPAMQETPSIIPGSGISTEDEIGYPLQDCGASLVTQMVKNLPAMQETWIHSLGSGDALEKGTPTQSSLLAWRILWREDPGSLQSMGSQGVGYDWATFTSLHT